jgi:hypothetical protein
MIPLAYAALFGIPVLAALWVFWWRGSAAAVAQALVFGWLSMPLLVIEIAGLPELQKETLLAPAIAVAAWISRRRHAGAVVPCWLDLPMIALCVSPLFASMTNDLGPIDGLKESFRSAAFFAAPWLLGRITLTDANAIFALGRALLLGAAVYAPFCLLESRLAPQLHEWIFGLPGRVGWETVGFYGPLRFKASVFLQSPLELTPLMGAGALFGWWSLRHLQGRARERTRLLVVAATVAMLMGKSLGGFVLTVLGAIALMATGIVRRRFVLVGLLCVVPLYVGLRASGAWDALDFVQFLSENVSERRADSFLVRVENENLLVQKALERPWFGWAGWGRSRVYDEYGNDISITDGFWVIALGTNGWFGLGAWMLVMLLPVAMTLWKRWRLVAGDGVDRVVLCAATVPLMHAIDCLANAMPNPVYYVLLAAVVSYYQTSLRPVAEATTLLRRLTARLGGKTLAPRASSPHR